VTQKQTVLMLLQTRGFKGVSVHELIYEKGITRAAAIVHDLRNEGIDIDTIDEGDTKLARYVLHDSNVAPPRDCECGHRKRVHLSNEGKCMDMLNPEAFIDPVIPCECVAYRG
jgi:hypothetical protein